MQAIRYSYTNKTFNERLLDGYSDKLTKLYVSKILVHDREDVADIYTRQSNI